ncbi:MAG: peptidylprolyl isomerase, partial [Gammaproteobacteria bacterium]|nr:peptidylprolyl isomerase [Gammaproteobacteria bacterium]
HILIEVAEGAKEEEVTVALGKVKDIKKQLDAGNDFAELARKHSEDIGSASLGGDIGVLEKGSMDPDFEAAVYKLNEGESSEPVRSAYGFHIIKLTSLTSEYGKSFDEVRTEVEAQYRQREAEGIFYDQADLLIDLTYENPESLDIAAKELGLKIKESEWFTRQGLPAGIAKYPNAVNTAFSEDALGGGDISKGNNSKSIELQSDDTSRLNPILVLHVSDYEPSRQRTMQEVHSIIESSLQQEGIRQKAREEGEKLLADARDGVDMDKLATDNQLELIKAGYIKRSETGHDAAIIRKAFGIGSKATGTVYDSAALASGGVAIISVSGEKSGESSIVTEQEKKYLSQFMQKSVGSSELDAMVKMMREESDVIVFADRLKDDEI